MVTENTYQKWKLKAKQLRIALELQEETGGNSPAWKARITQKLVVLQAKIDEYEKGSGA